MFGSFVKAGLVLVVSLALVSCSGTSTVVGGKPCPRCERVIGNNANARVAWEQSHWECAVDGKAVNCTATKGAACGACMAGR